MQDVIDSRSAFILIFGGIKIGVDFANLQEAELLGTVINKSGLQPGFDPNHDRFVNVSFGLLLPGDLDIEFA